MREGFQSTGDREAARKGEAGRPGALLCLILLSSTAKRPGMGRSTPASQALKPNEFGFANVWAATPQRAGTSRSTLAGVEIRQIN